MDESERLLELLKYAQEAIDYWFRDCDCSDENRNENDYFKDECSYFINNIKDKKIVTETFKEKIVTITHDLAINLKLKTGLPLNKCYKALQLFEGNIKQAQAYLEMVNDGVVRKKFGTPFTERDYIDVIKNKIK